MKPMGGNKEKKVLYLSRQTTLFVRIVVTILYTSFLKISTYVPMDKKLLFQ